MEERTILKKWKRKGISKSQVKMHHPCGDSTSAPCPKQCKMEERDEEHKTIEKRALKTQLKLKQKWRKGMS